MKPRVPMGMPAGTNLSMLNPTPVFESYCKLAAERYRIYEKRLRGEPPPWTPDPILREYKFTNTFRACDRVSQFCILEVIYNPNASNHAEGVVFRILLFKLFNSIPAWEVLTAKFGIPTWKGFNEQAYADALGKAWAGGKGKGVDIWSRAYVQNQKYRTDLPTKHCRRIGL
jgi:hypothetical protein